MSVLDTVSGAGLANPLGGGGFQASSSAFARSDSSASQSTGDIILGGGSKGLNMDLILLGGAALFLLAIFKKK